ncbi:U-box domain-containing protein 51-like [Malania oleifera]|uniref:U-box domain-containing protein 51-like n=1 Tax=Malania oleifera TaxID=397392 RepID=UPI0025AE25D2|nr:U-box domain-containing protein 51-like [Malania oleifera]XP_057980191.1 U-box domain-containing protein 51-like [Malania oleifera]
MRSSGENRGRKLIAVAVDKDRGSQNALKWAIDNITKNRENLILVHVNAKPPTSHIAGSSETGNDDILAGKEPINPIAELFFPFRCYCIRRQVQCDVVALEDTNIAKALIEFISERKIETLVLGATSRTSISKLFKCTDVPGQVSKWAPEFCTVCVISKSKATSIRASSRRPPLMSGMDQRTPFSSRMNDDTDSIGTAADYRLPDEISAPDVSMPFISPDRRSTDSAFLSFYENLGLERAGQRSEGLNMDDDVFESICTRSKSVDMKALHELSSNMEDVGIKSCLPDLEDVDEKIERLSLELNRIIEMYHEVSKEALAAQQKARELHNWKLEEEQRLKEAQLAAEVALATAEKEKAKCAAAIEAAEAAQRIAKLEAQKRKEAETKAGKETEEKMKALEALGHSKMVLKYQLMFHVLAVLFLVYFNFIEVKFFNSI